jgi:hypothetical protein
MTRPASIREVVQRATDLRTFSFELKDFLHEFERDPACSRLREEPEILAPRFPQGEIADAWAAAVADALAERLHKWGPDWTRRPERRLRDPWFATPGPAMRACLLLESPTAFRERNLFVTANVLSVA